MLRPLSVSISLSPLTAVWWSRLIFPETRFLWAFSSPGAKEEKGGKGRNRREEQKVKGKMQVPCLFGVLMFALPSQNEETKRSEMAKMVTDDVDSFRQQQEEQRKINLECTRKLVDIFGRVDAEEEDEARLALETFVESIWAFWNEVGKEKRTQKRGQPGLRLVLDSDLELMFFETMVKAMKDVGEAKALRWFREDGSLTTQDPVGEKLLNHKELDKAGHSYWTLGWTIKQFQEIARDGKTAWTLKRLHKKGILTDFAMEDLA